MNSITIKHKIIITLILAIFAGLGQVQAQTTKTVTAAAERPSGNEAVEQIIREYLLKNPKVIREAMQALQVQEEKEKQELAASNLKRVGKELFADPNTPTAGNTNGDVSVAAFFDYNCGHCKRSVPALNELAKRDPSARIVYKEFPILNSQSYLAAQAALAANRQGKYVEFHDALFAAATINDQTIKSISDSLGLSYEKLLKDMQDETTRGALAKNYALATDLGINGTPAYIIGEQVVPGAIDAEALIRIVAAERAKLGVKAANVIEKPQAQQLARQ